MSTIQNNNSYKLSFSRESMGKKKKRHLTVRLKLPERKNYVDGIYYNKRSRSQETLMIRDGVAYDVNGEAHDASRLYHLEKIDEESVQIRRAYHKNELALLSGEIPKTPVPRRKRSGHAILR